ncbi:hypothetical protein HPB48_010339 [Haemaphysalis longicornis]|uniref:Uncharacterized protein n=1 Tax=Haemaphysalis longicornis TaxID=44386 RepID=A0A9J6H5J8_HAELO|nr:hypothetical protein HPB48_010339 [Haemaphysalis longicornis]
MDKKTPKTGKNAVKDASSRARSSKTGGNRNKPKPSVAKAGKSTYKDASAADGHDELPTVQKVPMPEPAAQDPVRDDPDGTVKADSDEAKREVSEPTMSVALDVNTLLGAESINDLREKAVEPQASDGVDDVEKNEDVVSQEELGAKADDETGSNAAAAPEVFSDAVTGHPTHTRPSLGASSTTQPKLAERRQSITFKKNRAKRTKPKRKRSRKGRSQSVHKAVQANLEETKVAAGPPLHVLLSPSTCSLCERHPTVGSGAYFDDRLGGPYALEYRNAEHAPPDNQNGITSTRTVTTTRRIKNRDKIKGAPETVEEITEEITEGADGSARARQFKHDKRSSKAGETGGSTKKIITTTRRKRGSGPNRRKDGSSDFDEAVTTQVSEPPDTSQPGPSNEEEHSVASASNNSQLPKGGRSNVGGASRKLKTARRPGVADTKNGSSEESADIDEEIITEVVEPFVSPTANSTSGRRVPGPYPIAGLARDASTTQYRYVETRRPASSSGQTLPWTSALSPVQHMQLRAAQFWADRGYYHPA